MSRQWRARRLGTNAHMSVPATANGQGQQAGHLHEHGAVAEALLGGEHLERAALVAGRQELGDRVRHRVQVLDGEGAVLRATSSTATTRQTSSSVKIGCVRPGKSKPSGATIRSRFISWLSNRSREGGVLSKDTEQPGACSRISRVSGSESTVMAYSDMLTSNCLVLDPGSNSRWLPSSASAASTASATSGPQLLAERGQLEPAAGAHEQLVVEVLAQPGERAAHRRLAHRHPGAGVGEVALLEQRVQREQQVGVDLAQRVGHGCHLSRMSGMPGHRMTAVTRSCDTVPMPLGGTDLNLLLPLKVLLEEGNVTRAGQRLSLSQPAMSAALARLRRKFDDELLTRNGRDYDLTPFAVELLPEVQQALRLMSKALHVEEGFDPSTSRAHLPPDDERLRDLGRARAAAGADQRARSRRTPAHRPPRPGHPFLRPRPAGVRRPDRPARVRLPGRVASAVARPDGAAGRPASPRPEHGLSLEDLARLPHAAGDLRARHPDAGRPGLRRARHPPPHPGERLGLAAAAVRHRGHQPGRRRTRAAGEAAHQRQRTARAGGAAVRRGGAGGGLLVRPRPARRPGARVVLRPARRGGGALAD